MKLRHMTLMIYALSFWLAVAAAETSPRKQDGRQAGEYPTYELWTPSGNIHCYVDLVGSRESGMRCLVNRIAKTLPRPKDIEGCDWTGGRYFQLGADGAGRGFAPCDAREPNQPLVRLVYGTVWKRGPFTCLSARIALLCTNRTGHGLYLSFEEQRAF